MNKTYKYLGFAAVGLLAAVSASCTMDTPFGDIEQGDGTLHLSTDIKGQTITRAEIEVEEMKALREKAIVYIERESSNGDRHEVIRKYFGLETIPGNISLSKGHSYIAEGWTGDSVSASFDAKFYRGKTEAFHVEDQTTVSLKLNIANVLVSFAPETLELGLKDLTMTVGHSRGELTFSEAAEGGSTLFNTGYFMMPSTDKSLTYSITATNAEGEPIEYSGVIENVQRAHQYQVRLKPNETPQWGAGLIKIEIEDIPVIEEEVEIFGRPFIQGVEFDLEDQVIGTPGTFVEKQVFVCAYKGMAALTIGGDKAPDVIKNLANHEISRNTAAEQAEIENLGIHVDHTTGKIDAASGVLLDEYTFFFRKEFFDNLPESNEEYVIEISARDLDGKQTDATLRIANTEEAIVVMAPVDVAPLPDPAREPMAITGSKAALTGYLYDAEVNDYGMLYRESGSSDWKKISAKAGGNAARRKLRSMTRAEIATRAEKVPFTVTLTGLNPGTTYEYKVYADDYEQKYVSTFSTESVYQIPNASFENWSTYSAKTMLGTKNVTLPGAEGDKTLSFWGSGNEGAATASMTLTDKSTDMKQSGSYSARLESKSAMGVLAAGNIFVGEYVKTDGTNGVLSLGRSYDGTHPAKLKVWANYRPASGASVKSGNEGFVPEGFSGGSDHGQIYVALTTEPIEIRTNPSNRKLLDKDEAAVLAYGERTFTSSFGPDGSLESLEIPIEYNARANTQRPKYLVIVVSASKYGDYFSGAAGSVMYVDDFELIY